MRGVALLAEFLSVHLKLSSAASLASYRELEHVAVWRYGQAPPALRAVVAASRQDPAEFAPHSLRIGEASLPASGGSVSEHVITKEMR